MDYREEALVIIKERLKRDRDVLGIVSIERNSNTPISKTNVPAIYIFEGRDIITKYQNKTPLGYPVIRNLEINIEIVAKRDRESKGIKDLLKKIRKSIFCERTGEDGSYVYIPSHILVDKGYAIIKELRVKGPGTYEVPELVGIKLVIGLQYTDFGFLE